MSNLNSAGDEQQQDVHRLQDKVILIINGLSESGRKLANMLARHGADVAIIDSRKNSTLVQQIRKEVAEKGQRCLVLIQDEDPETTKSFSQVAIQLIVDTLGQLDSFVSYSTNKGLADSAKLADAQTLPPQTRSNLAPWLMIFDRNGMTRAALNHIIHHGAE